MHLETLGVFCDLIESGSFSIAATHNFITQSAVSQQIRALENRFDRKLVERTRGRIRPTPAGDILYQIAKEIITRYRELEDKLNAFSNVVTGSVRLATVHSVGLYELSGPLKKFLKAFPQVNVHLQYRRSNMIIEEILRGNIDIGIVAYPTARPQIGVVPFREDKLVLACPPGHHLARFRRVPLKKLAGEAFVGYERDIPTRKATDRILRKAGVQVRYVMELDNIETIKRVVEIGTGIAIVPEPAIRQEVKNRSLVAVQLGDEDFIRPVGIVHKQGRVFSPAVEKFIEFLRKG